MRGKTKMSKDSKREVVGDARMRSEIQILKSGHSDEYYSDLREQRRKMPFGFALSKKPK